MNIGGVMRSKLVTARPDESAADAIRRMLSSGIGSVIVIEDNAPVGMFTERDVLRLAGEGTDFETIPVRRAMTGRPLTIAADDDILAASQMMAERKLRHLPVTEDGNLVGIVSMRDVLAYLAERLYSGDKDDAAHNTTRALLDRH
jgi:CBS domain-containing protein